MNLLSKEAPSPPKLSIAFNSYPAQSPADAMVVEPPWRSTGMIFPVKKRHLSREMTLRLDVPLEGLGSMVIGTVGDVTPIYPRL